MGSAIMNGQSAVKNEQVEKRLPTAGLKVPAVFCGEEWKDPFDSVKWETRTAVIKDESGGVMFEQKDHPNSLRKQVNLYLNLLQKHLNLRLS